MRATRRRLPATFFDGHGETYPLRVPEDQRTVEQETRLDGLIGHTPCVLASEAGQAVWLVWLACSCRRPFVPSLNITAPPPWFLVGNEGMDPCNSPWLQSL